MGMHQPNYTGLEYHEEFIRAQTVRATDDLLVLLCIHHPEQCPQAAAEYQNRFAIEIAPPEPDHETVPLPTEEDRIAAWIAKQKEMLPEGFRDWNVEATYPSVLTIQRAVCAKYNISRTDLVSSRRTKNVVGPRQLAIYLARKLTTRSLPYIAGKFGGRDHTTALHAVNKIERKIASDCEFAAQVEALKQVISEA